MKGPGHRGTVTSELHWQVPLKGRRGADSAYPSAGFRVGDRTNLGPGLGPGPGQGWVMARELSVTPSGSLLGVRVAQVMTN